MKNVIGLFYETNVIANCVKSLLDTPCWSEDGDGVVQKFSDTNRQTYFSQTLPALGFYNITDGNKLVPIQITNNVARRVSHREVREYVMYCFNRLPIGNRVLDQMTMEYNKFFSENVLTSLRCLDLPFITDTRQTATCYYLNGAIKVNSLCDSVTLTPYEDLDAFVWASDVIDRYFDASLLSDGFDGDEFIKDMNIDGIGGHQFHRWCQNLCRSQDPSGSWIYYPNRFKALASAFGFLLHKKWNDSKCVVFVDEDMSHGSANGRTGKSVVLNDALSHLLPTVVIDARAVKKSSSNQFTFNFVNEETRHITLDDACEDFEFNTLFSIITGDLVVNKKYGGMSQFSKSSKPKISISSNHPILGEGTSYVDRQHTVEIGGFYRFNKFSLGKSPDVFHGGYLFDEEWSDENWKQFDLFAVHSLLYYLKNGLLNTGCSGKYQYNKLVSSVGSAILVNSLTNFLQDHNGIEVYSKSVDGMTEEEVSRCVRDHALVQGLENGETYSTIQISTALTLVASYLGYNKNIGLKDRNQKRFGDDRKCVDYFIFTNKSSPFPSSSPNISLDTTSISSTDEHTFDDNNDVELMFADLGTSR